MYWPTNIDPNIFVFVLGPENNIGHTLVQKHPKASNKLKKHPKASKSVQKHSKASKSVINGPTTCSQQQQKKLPEFFFVVKGSK